MGSSWSGLGRAAGSRYSPAFTRDPPPPPLAPHTTSANRRYVMMMRTCSGTYCQSSFRKYLIFWIESAFSTLSSDVHQSTLTEGKRCIFHHLGRDNILAIFHLMRNPNILADYDADYVL